MGVAANGDKTDKILHGIQLVLVEIRDLREESKQRHVEFLGFARRAEEDRKRSDERFERLMARSDERWDRLEARGEQHQKEAAQDRSDFTQTLASMRDAHLVIIGNQQQQTKLLEENTKILKDIRNGKKNGK